MKRFIIRNEHIRANAKAMIDQLPLEPLYAVWIEAYEPDKSVSQQRTYHWLCGLLGKEIGLSKGSVKMLTKGIYFGIVETNYCGLKWSIPDGDSEGLNKKQYNELIEVVYQVAAEAQVTLPEPDPAMRKR